MPKPCPNHEWVVYSTILKENYLLVQCVKCGMIGTVQDPTADEWSAAFYAPSVPYQWMESGRVKEEQAAALRVAPKQPGKRCECVKAGRVQAPADYERVADEITKMDRPLTAEERSELKQLAEMVAKSDDLCSLFFPLFISSYQDATGSEPSAAVRVIAERIGKWHRAGLHQSPGVIAKILRDVAAQ